MRKGQRRKQTGSLFHNDSSWYVRVFEDVWDAQTKTVVRRRVAKKLPVPFAPPYDTEASVQRYVEDILHPLNAGTANPLSTRTVRDFTEHEYFPRLEQRGARTITKKTYLALWRRYIAPYLGDIALRDFSTRQGEDLLLAIARHKKLSASTWGHLKALLSNIFLTAIRLDLLNPGAANPMHGAQLPKAGGSGRADGHGRQPFYTFEEIQTLLLILKEPARTVCLLAAHTGLRRAEISGLQWSDLSADYRSLTIARGVCNGEVNAPKTPGSRATIPVTQQLGAALRAHRGRSGPYPSGWIFVGQTGNPLNLDILAVRHIKPALKGTTVVWKGWHAFRRGTATCLHRLGVDDHTIKVILRHTDITMTQNIYIGLDTEQDSRAALEKLGDALAVPDQRQTGKA